MLAAERRRVITERIQATGQLVVSALSVEFQVSEETIRRDLEWLEKEGIATRIYGGAVLAGNDRAAPPYSIRKNTSIEPKVAIARLLSRLVREGDTLMVDESSTAAYAIRALRHLKHLTLITNSLELLREATGQDGWHVISTGGTLKKGSLALVGTSAERMIREFHVDMAICSAKGIDIARGVTDSNEKDTEIKRAIFSSANRKVLAIDSTKFDKLSFVRVCDIQEIDTIVTDRQPSERWMEYLRDRRVEVLY